MTVRAAPAATRTGAASNSVFSPQQARNVRHRTLPVLVSEICHPRAGLGWLYPELLDRVVALECGDARMHPLLVMRGDARAIDWREQLFLG